MVGVGPEVEEEKRDAKAQYELCEMSSECNDSEDDLASEFPGIGLD